MTRAYVPTIALLVAVALTSGTAHADCKPPIAPSKVPDGATASEPEMMTAMQTLKRYDGDVNTFVKCLEFEVKRDRLTSVEQTKLHNAAIDQLQRIAGEFNGQVRVYKSKQT